MSTTLAGQDASAMDRDILAKDFPEELRHLAGRITDLDAHEMLPLQEWVKAFGPDVQELADFFVKYGASEEETINTVHVPDFPGDVLPIGDNILSIKGSRAPSAVRADRRTEVMDVMGLSRQLYYPTGMVLFANVLYKAAHDPRVMADIKGDRRGRVKNWFHSYNAWLKSQNLDVNRIRAAALLFGETPEEIIQVAKDNIAAGFRAFYYVPASELPGGRSPAHPDLDPLWALLAENDCAFTLHIEAAPSKLNPWHEAPAFENFVTHGEFNRNPAFLVTNHLAYENFLTIMLLGGVFERHPNLRFGLIELGSIWVGPMMERLDMWYHMENRFARQDNALFKKETYRLPNPPSFYLKRNVRVTPFPFEDVAKDITRYGLEKVLCFSTDYPHVEGGRNAFRIFYDKIKDLGPEVVEDFFVNNGAWLMPD